jgi:hypothetical protein
MDNKYCIQIIWVLYQFVYLCLVFPFYCFSLFVRPRKERWIFGAQRGHAFSDNAKHLFLYVHEKSDVTAAWITRNQSIVEDLKSKGYRAYYFYSLAGLYYCMSSSVAVVTHMGNNMRGDLPFFALNRKASIVQLWHGIPLKKIGFDDKLFSTTGNPPALPGDLRSLTVPGVNESLPSVNRSKFSEKEAFDETHPKPKSFGLGLQVPRCLDTQVSPKGAVWSDSATSWGGHPRVGPATRESGVGRTFVR